MSAASDVTNMALFCDFENIALGVQDAKYEKFDIKKVLERLLLKGSIVVKKAYCDWERYKAFKAPMHEASFELIEIPHVRQAGKNSADIRLVVDALDLCYTKSHVDTFVIISGDSDFSPLVSKLRENDKTVIGVGVKNSTSDLLIANCDEFIFYDDLVREQRRKAGTARKPAAKPKADAAKTEATAPAAAKAVAAKAEAAPAEGKEPKGARGGRSRARGKSAKSAADEAPVVAAASGAAAAGELAASEAFAGDVPVAEATAAEERPEESKQARAIEMAVETLVALVAERGEGETIWGSMVKQTLKRRQPGFNESYYGFRSFNALLEEAQRRGLVTLVLDEKSGGYKVRPAAAAD